MRRVLLILATALAMAAPDAFADKPAHAGKGKGKDKNKGRSVEVVDRDDRVRFRDRDRDSWREYWHESYGRGNCPPGLAKKNNGCLPPGQAKKRYVVGRRLPTEIVIQPVPGVLVKRLDPLPPGYEYGMVDGDLIKLAAGRLVVDAIVSVLD